MNTSCKENIDKASAVPGPGNRSAQPSADLSAFAMPEPANKLQVMPVPENLAEDTKRVFNRLRGVIVKSTVLDELLAYASLIDEKASLLKEPSTLPPKVSQFVIASIDRQKLHASFAGLIERLRKETTLLAELEEIGLAKALPAGIENSTFGAKLMFAGEKRSLKDRLLGLKKAKKSAYNATLDLCLVEGTPPGAAQMWEALTTAGVLPDVIGHLDKVLTKDTQYSGFQRAKLAGASLAIASAFFVLPGGTIIAPLAAKKIMKHADNDQILSEIHALEAQASSQAFQGLPSEQKNRILESVIAENVSVKDAGQRAGKAYELVHSLRLLGFDDVKIGQLVDAASWDGKTGTWAVMEEALNKKRECLGLVSDEDYQLCLSALDARAVFETYFQRHRASRIAVEELLKLQTIGPINSL